MRRVGTVVQVAQGLVIVRCPGDDPPEIGTTVVDESLSTAGRVVDVFGPVDRPYAAVSPPDGVRPADFLGAKLYAR
jgi:RNA-binding protein